MGKNPKTVLGKQLKNCRRTGVFVSLIGAVTGILSVLFAIAVRNVLNNMGKSAGRMTFFIAELAVIAVAVPVLRAFTGYFSGHECDRESSALRAELLKTLQEKDFASVKSFSSGSSFSRISSDCYMVCDRYTRVLPSAAADVFQLICAVTALMILRPVFAWILLCGGILALAYIFVVRKVMRKKHLKAKQAEDKVFTELSRNIEHNELIRTSLNAEKTRERFASALDCMIKERKVLRLFESATGGALSLAIQCGYAAVIIWGAARIAGGELSFGDLTAIIQLIGLFRSPVTSLGGLQNRLALCDAGEQRLKELISLPDELPGDDMPEDAEPKAIVFDDVTFRYTADGEPVLEHFNARIPFGGWTRVKGASGIGKSTLFRLILGIYSPESGKVYIETEDGCYTVGKNTRKLFSTVLQMPFLLGGTVKENLLLANPGATDAQIARALAVAQCAFIEGRTDFNLDEKGKDLSIGQRQRITIARSLLVPCKMLLLDEITSSIDPETAKIMLRNIKTEYPCALISSHRDEFFDENPVEEINLEAKS